MARERDGAALNSRRFLTLTGQSRRGGEISQRNEKSIWYANAVRKRCIVWENNDRFRRGNSEGISEPRARRFFDREKLVCRSGAARCGVARRKRSIENEEFSRSECGGRGKGLKTFVGCLAARSRILVDRPDKRAVLVRDVTAIGRRFFALDVSKWRRGWRPYTLILKRFIDKDTET